MTTSGTYNYSPGAGDLVLISWVRAGKRRSQVLSEQMFDAYQEANLMLSDWSTRQGPNWWATDTYSTPITANVATYTLPANTIQLVAAYVTITAGASSTDRIMGPLSSYNYASLANKSQTGQPTSFWFNRQITPQITLYPVPDASATYTLNLRRWRNIQDTVITNAVQPEVPWRFLDAFVMGLASRLAWNSAMSSNSPLEIQKATALQQRAEASWLRASTNDEEDVPLRIQPTLSGYYR